MTQFFFHFQWGSFFSFQRFRPLSPFQQAVGYQIPSMCYQTKSHNHSRKRQIKLEPKLILGFPFTQNANTSNKWSQDSLQHKLYIHHMIGHMVNHLESIFSKQYLKLIVFRVIQKYFKRNKLQHAKEAQKSQNQIRWIIGTMVIVINIIDSSVTFATKNKCWL